MQSNGEKRRIAIVIPLFNESAVVAELTSRLSKVAFSLATYEWHILFVDDGSTDASVEAIMKHAPDLSSRVTLIRLSRNFGHQAALFAGLAAADADAIVFLDADLQDPPELIGSFLQKFEEGYDVVYGVRQEREENATKRAAYKLFYRLFEKLAEIPIALDAGDFGLISARVASYIVTMQERDMFLRGLRSWVGFKQIGIPYHRPIRWAGESKYSVTALIKLAASAFFGFSFVPLRVATSLGVITVVVSICYTAFAAVAAILYHAAPRGWASVIGVVSLIGGAQLIAIGIVGEYIGRIYKQTQGRPLYIVAEKTQISRGSRSAV